MSVCVRARIMHTSLQYVRGLGTELVQPVITPRFIPTCTPELLEGLGALARKYDCHIQSHLSESHDEMQVLYIYIHIYIYDVFLCMYT